MSGKKGERSTM